jgi:sodium/hydrogen antiporter
VPLAATLLVGAALGQGGLGVLSLDPRSGFVSVLAQAALIVLLFRDGLEIEGEMLQRAWRLPLRKLVLAMPITAGLVALAAHTFTDLSWSEALLLGALLSPTDPVLSSGIVTNPRVPRLIRHSLNLESGLNDGLALPAVLAFSAALRVDGGHFDVWRFVAQDVSLGFACGIAVGLGASLAIRRGAGLERRSMPDRLRALYLLGVAVATYEATVQLAHGNGFIAVFVAAITLGIRRADLRDAFQRRSDEVVEIVKLGIFLVFGSLLTVHGLLGEGWGAVAVVVVTLLVARPVAVWVALAGTGTARAVKAFMAWFGPKGVATMTFSLLVLGMHIQAGQRIFNLAALAVFCSVIVHGLTDTPGVAWIERRSGEDEADPAAGADRPRAHA